MARRTLLKPHDRQELFGIPTDEDSLMRHYSLSPADRLEIEVRRREHMADATPDQIDPTELTGFTRRTLRIVNALQA